jgi:hypothetical protein
MSGLYEGIAIQDAPETQRRVNGDLLGYTIVDVLRL